MTKGQTFDSQNTYRIAFYDEVIKRAQEVNFHLLQSTSGNNLSFKFTQHCQENPGKTARSPPRFVSQGKGVEEAGARLCKFIDPHNLLDSIKGRPRRPLVIISFDESHILTDNPQDTLWTLFSELRRVFRGIVEFAIFSVFLSTAGRFHRFSPEKRQDPSGRIANSVLRLLHPISEISFDDIAFPANENTVSLHRVVEMDWISHLGRPLYVPFDVPLASSLCTSHLD